VSVCWLLMQISSTTKIIESNRTMVEELIKFLVIGFGLMMTGGRKDAG